MNYKIHKKQGNFTICGVYVNATTKTSEKLGKVNCDSCRLIIYNDKQKNLTLYNRGKKRTPINLNITKRN